MDSTQTEIVIRRPWTEGETLFLQGPGGVGKSTLGRELAQRLGWPLIDLDLEFCEQLQSIGRFIADHGYPRYRAENLALAGRLFVTSSGFLAAEPHSADHQSARRIVAGGYGVTLLPSLDIDVATAIVVTRQLRRGFGLEQASEERKFRQRFHIYHQAGAMLVVSTDAAAAIAEELLDRLRR